MLSSPYPRLPWSCGRGCRVGAGAGVNAPQTLRMIDVAKSRMFCAMSRSLSFVQPTARVRRTSTVAWCRFLAVPNGEPFVLIYDPVIRLIGASDRVLRLTMRIIEPDNLIAALPDLGLTILRVGDGLSHGKTVAA
jgi:hypothetical protein